LAAEISKEGHTTIALNDAESAVHRAKAWLPQLIVIEEDHQLISKFRTALGDDHASIIFSTSQHSREGLLQALQAGADDYMVKPLRPDELFCRIHAMLRLKDLLDSLKRANHRIDDLMTTDELTGLYNFKALLRRGEEEIVRAHRFKKPLSALMINID